MLDKWVDLWVLKKSSLVVDLAGFWDRREFGSVRVVRLRATVAGPIVGVLRNRTSRLMFWAVAARKNCSWTNFNRRRR
jgi:hypothetical protein